MRRKRLSAMKESILRNSITRSLRKDFRIEFRSKYALNISIAFAVISTLAVSLTTGGIPISVKMQAVILWIILFFSAMSGLSHIFIREEEQETILFLQLYSKSEVILTSKLLFNIFLLFLLELVIVPLFIFFLNLQIKAIIPFIFTIISGGLGISSSTTILAAIASKSGSKGSLFTVISFPVVLPILWMASDATSRALTNARFEGIQNIIFLLAFSVSITALSYILFEYIWIEE